MVSRCGGQRSSSGDGSVSAGSRQADVRSVSQASECSPVSTPKSTSSHTDNPMIAQATKAANRTTRTAVKVMTVPLGEAGSDGVRRNGPPHHPPVAHPAGGAEGHRREGQGPSGRQLRRPRFSSKPATWPRGSSSRGAVAISICVRA
ncbi:Uncharacterised protein [Clostridioides difficile]|nr:Uncharacterised protein [Clostridioides difficile]